ncbi:DAK2 domain-containing protein [Nesterenkonia suensis]
MRGKVKGRQAVLEWFARAEQALETHRGQLDQLNVFPVPDSDTGTNLLAATQTCRRAAEGSTQEDLGELLAEVGSAAMVEAHGNSGTLLAVLLSGIAEPFHGQERLTAPQLADALDRASLRAWTALSEPVAGTMLSVLDAVAVEIRSCAAEIQEPESRAALEDCLRRALRTGRAAVEATTDQLEVLRAAGVVDAGGAGLLLILDALRATVCGEALSEDLLEGLPGLQGAESETEAHSTHDQGAPQGASWPHTEPAHGAHLVEIMATVRLDPLGAASLRHRLDELGDSVIITPVDAEPDAAGAYRWRVHVHTGRRAPTAEAIRSAGSVEALTLTELGV